MNDSILLGILIVIAIAFVIQAFRRLPSFSLRLGDSPPKKRKVSKKPAVTHTTVRQASTTSGEATSLDDEYRFNFRSARWGMPREQVKRSDDFSQPESEDATTITYKTRLGHMSCTVTFTMSVGDELIGGRYDFTSIYEDGARYLSDFDTLLELYKERFGDPLRTAIEWGNRTFEKKKEFHGVAFMEGHFTRCVQWQTPRTSVVLFLGNSQGNIDFHIEYKCLDHTPLTPDEEPTHLIPDAQATTEAHTLEKQARNGHLTDRQTENGQPESGQPKGGQPVNGRIVNGNPTNGHVTGERGAQKIPTVEPVLAKPALANPVTGKHAMGENPATEHPTTTKLPTEELPDTTK